MKKFSIHPAAPYSSTRADSSHRAAQRPNPMRNTDNSTSPRTMNTRRTNDDNAVASSSKKLTTTIHTGSKRSATPIVGDANGSKRARTTFTQLRSPITPVNENIPARAMERLSPTKRNFHSNEDSAALNYEDSEDGEDDFDSDEIDETDEDDEDEDSDEDSDEESDKDPNSDNQSFHTARSKPSSAPPRPLSQHSRLYQLNGHLADINYLQKAKTRARNRARGYGVRPRSSEWANPRLYESPLAEPEQHFDATANDIVPLPVITVTAAEGGETLFSRSDINWESCLATEYRGSDPHRYRLREK